jgi:hypothetical protein
MATTGVRELFEKLRSYGIELDPEISEYNARGFTWMNPAAGGGREAACGVLSRSGSHSAAKMAPRTRMLRRIQQVDGSGARMNSRDIEPRESRLLLWAAERKNHELLIDASPLSY